MRFMKSFISKKKKKILGYGMRRSPTILRDILPPFSGLKSKQIKQPENFADALNV
jgi:hypothetical protein